MAVNYNPKLVTDGLVMCLDAANPKSFSPNTFPKSTDIYSWYVTQRGNNVGNSCTVSQDLATPKSPANGIPMRMDVSGNDAHIGSYSEAGGAAPWNISTALTGQTWRVSVYAKASQILNDCQIFIFGANSTGNAFNVAAGSYYAITATAIAVTTEWQRFDHFITFNNPDIAFIQMRLDGPNVGGAGTTVWWDGLQVEPYTLTKFNPVYNQNYSKITNLVDNSQLLSVLNYPQYNNAGYIIFNGINNYISIPQIILNRNNSAFSVWFTAGVDFTGNYANRGIILGNSGNKFTNLFGISISNFIQGETLLNEEYFSNGVISNGWNNAHVSFIDGIATTYVNGIYVSVSPLLTADFIVNEIAGSDTTANYQGNISSVLFYNRGLSESEVVQNFNATRSRYGI